MAVRASTTRTHLEWDSGIPPRLALVDSGTCQLVQVITQR